MEIFLKCLTKTSPEDEQAKRVNSRIDKTISKSKTALRKEQKILLLGTGECGKSTFIKQMRIILGGGFPEEAYEYYTRVVHKNLLQAAASLAGAMRNLDIAYQDQSLAADCEPLIELFSEKENDLEPELLAADQLAVIRRLWGDSGVMACYDRRREFSLLDSAKYFLDKVGEIEKPNYKLDVQDILRSRVRTTGIIEEVFNVDKISLKIIDVGGQRRERRKWIHSFEGVTSVIFLASLSEYDMFLQECKTKNRTEESLQLFNSIVDYPWFRKSSLILFLNKKDIFAEKIKTSPLGHHLPGYRGPEGDLYEGWKFMASLYKKEYARAEKRDSTRKLYVHFTCATDTENIKIIFKNIRETILNRNIAEMNLAQQTAGAEVFMPADPENPDSKPETLEFTN